MIQGFLGPLAGIGSRFLAVALDTLIQALAGLLLLILAAVLAAGIGEFLPSGSIWTTAVVILVAFCLYFGYFAIFEVVWNGQTPGKRLTRLRVIDESGRPVSVYQVIARNLLRIVDQLPSFYAVAIVSVMLSRQNKRLGDHLAGTVVVHEKPFEEVQPEWGSAEKTAITQYGRVVSAPKRFN